MKRKFHAIPVLIYAPVDVYPDANDVYDHIKLGENLSVFLAEDYKDGMVELDPAWTEFSGQITMDCKRSFTDII